MSVRSLTDMADKAHATHSFSRPVTSAVAVSVVVAGPAAAAAVVEARVSVMTAVSTSDGSFCRRSFVPSIDLFCSVLFTECFNNCIVKDGIGNAARSVISYINSSISALARAEFVRCHACSFPSAYLPSDTATSSRRSNQNMEVISKPSTGSQQIP